MAQVFLGMSGGVDSSAAAVLLQEQGYAVSGLHLSLLSGLPLPADRLPDDGSDARAVASLLGLPFYDMDLSPEFRATVIDYFIREYEAGRTPNPCVFCNRRIKFGAMWDAAQKLGADYLAVSSLDEGRELRHGGITMPILILGHTPPEMVSQLIEYNITQAVSAKAKAEAYSAEAVKCGGTLRVHIKVDTGMSRLGFLVRGEHFETGVEAIAESCALPGLDPEGIFTHFAVSDMDGADYEAYTREQFGVFTHVLDALAAKGRTFRIRHCANSGALTRYPEMYLDMVRPGIALYGVGDDAERLGLRPVMRLKSCVSTIKVLDPDTTVSYGRTFRTEGKTRMGVLPIGYADGFFRGLSNRMAVQTAYGPAPQRGRICMDMCMVDLTDLPEVKVGDTVEIFGQTQSVDSLAAILNTIPYELTCAVSKRVPRLYMENGKEIERSLRLL